MILKKTLLATAAFVTATAGLNAGAPPTVMFLPDKAWCNAHEYVTKSERNGKVRITENYDEALTYDVSNPKADHALLTSFCPRHPESCNISAKHAAAIIGLRIFIGLLALFSEFVA